MAANQQANPQAPTRPPGDNNEETPTHGQHEDNVFNIQLPYDINAPTEPELWSGSFHPISLHGSMEHVASDFKNVKVTLNFLAKFIQNKQVDGNSANDFSDFEGMGDAIWNFISSVYGAKCDVLHTDNKSNTLRAKISSKFTPKILAPASNGNNKKEIPKYTPVTINKAPPSSSFAGQVKEGNQHDFKVFPYEEKSSRIL